MKTETTWQQLQERVDELRTLQGAMGVLNWDQQVKMPSGGSTARGRQLSLLSGIHHERLTDPRLGELIEALTDSQDPVHQAAVRNMGRCYRRAKRLPAALVRATAEAETRGFTAWMEARQADSFEPFAPALEELVSLTRQQIDHLREDHADPYDVLLEHYDPGSTVAELDPMFSRLAEGLEAFLQDIKGRPEPGAPIKGDFDLAAQRALHDDIVRSLGFDFERGRMDPSEHPFTVGIDHGDVRITTHFYPDDLLAGLGGTIHETGHALYEQGLPSQLKSSSVDSAASFGLHESQSRFWENFIGRSEPFCEWLAGRVDEHLPGTGVTGASLYGAANRVSPSLIRIFADEVTYNLHIVVRYQLERALLAGEIAVADLPVAWSDRTESVLGVRPPTLGEGVLQDVHWSSGLFAYFPSYTLGNLYAASLGAAIVDDLPDLWDQVRQGEFAPVLAWLREKVHSKGHLVDAPEIVRAAVGERDHVDDLLTHIRGRQGALYGLS